jgi:predicted amidohydrolase YtcJ
VTLGWVPKWKRYLNIASACEDLDRPTEALTREQAVIACTLGSAYAESAERGTLDSGKLADLAVLSQDIHFAK